MKKNNLLLTVVACLMLPGTLYAETCSVYTLEEGGNPCDDMNQDYCDSEGSNTYYMSTSGFCWGRKTCNKCQAGYTAITENLGDCTNITYTYCDCICDNCKDDTTWSSAGKAGYLKKATRRCICSSGTPTCTIVKTDYKCNAGYYGSSTNGTSGCTKCPTTEEGGAGKSDDDVIYSEVGSTQITDCYVGALSFITDTSGEFMFVDDCYYK